MRTEKFLHRNVWDVKDKRELDDLLLREKKHLLLKPGKSPKRFEAVDSRYKDELPDDEPLFVSEYLKEKMIAE